MVSLALLVLAATPSRAAESPAPPVDAEVLRDLDVVGSPSYTRDRELGRKLRLVERMRLLEGLRQLEAEAPPQPVVPQPVVQPTPTPVPAAPREVK